VGGRGRSRTRLVAVIVAVLGVALLVAGSVPETAGAAGGADGATVQVTAAAVDPASVQVTPGSAVTWYNATTANLSVVADDGSFDSGALAPKSTFQFVFPAVRTVSYHVLGGPGVDGLTGTVEVAAGVAAPPAPAPSASPFAPNPAATPPSNLAYSGTQGLNGFFGALALAFGVALVVWARRHGLTLAWLGSPFARSDDLLPRLGHRRARPARGPGAPRRSRHRI
jgi:plastocyanin